MFCTKCGCQLSDDAVFCQQCGAKVQAAASVDRTGRNSSAGNELDREALKIYLSDLLSLECIKRKYLIRLRQLDKEESYLKNNNLYKTDQLFGEYNPRSASNSCFHLYYNGEKYYIAYVDNTHFHSGIYTNSWLSREDSYKWLEIESNLKYLQDPYAWRQSTYPCTGRFEEKKRRKIARDKFFQVYEEFKKSAPVLYQKNLRTLKANIKAQKDILDELNEIDKLLDKSYALNIIPEMLRHKLYAIYYLHSFICTSNESLTTALLHYNLNEIKAKLDTIIEQQQEIIIQQAVMTAQNEQMLQRNQVQLERLAAIESNTDRAAQYAEIAANHAEACAWIGLANYLGK